MIIACSNSHVLEEKKKKKENKELGSMQYILHCNSASL
jgi:hypothetical protein